MKKILFTPIVLLLSLWHLQAQEFAPNIVTKTECRTLSASSGCLNVLNQSHLGVGLTGGNSFSVTADAYNNGQLGQYKLISTLNYIVVESFDDVNITADWKATVKMNVTRTSDGVTFDTRNIEIPVEYSNSHLQTENHRSVYVFDGLSYSSITINQIDIVDASGVSINNNHTSVGNMNIELYVEEERYDIDQNPWSMNTLSVSSTTNNSYFKANWSVGSAEPYPCNFELEWAFKSSEDNDYTSFLSNITSNGIAESATLFEDNSSKVVTNETSYPLILNDLEHDGTLYLRYRRVRPTFEAPYTINHRFKKYSKWNYTSLTINSSNRFDAKQKNWTVESTLAEDDKRKDVIS